MLSHPHISVMLQTDYKDVIDSLSFEKLIYTGPTDSYFDYKYGKLFYRSLKFEHETFNQKFIRNTSKSIIQMTMTLPGLLNGNMLQDRKV
jgi:UDP-galactopyranose mutase